MPIWLLFNCCWCCCCCCCCFFWTMLMPLCENEKVASRHHVLTIMLFCFNLLVALASTFHRFSGFLAIVTFNSYGSNMARIWCNTNPTPARLVTPPHVSPAERITPSGRSGNPSRRVTLSVNDRDRTKWEIRWTGGLPHLTGLPHLPGVPPPPDPKSISNDFLWFIICSF